MGYLELLEPIDQVSTESQVSLPEAKAGYQVVAVWDFGRIHLANGETWIVGKRLDKPGWKSWPVKKG